MKAVLISIKPKWCALIANGQKTIEVRKTVPKLKPPFKCYIYCTNNGAFMVQSKANPALSKNHINKYGGKVIGEFVCDNIVEYDSEFWDDNSVYQAISRINYDDEGDYEWVNIASNEDDNPSDNYLCKESCLSFEEIQQYAGNNRFYGWHIFDLVIYDKPKELSDFVKANAEQFEKLDGRGVLCEYCADREVNGYDEISNTWFDCGECDCWEAYQEYIKIKYPPRSWCYVEE